MTNCNDWEKQITIKVSCIKTGTKHEEQNGIRCVLSNDWNDDGSLQERLSFGSEFQRVGPATE